MIRLKFGCVFFQSSGSILADRRSAARTQTHTEHSVVNLKLALAIASVNGGSAALG